MRADSDQLGLTQRAVNKLREVRLTLFGAISFRGSWAELEVRESYREAFLSRSPECQSRQPWFI